MVKAKIKMNNTNGVTPLPIVERLIKNNITVHDFFMIHEKFLLDKSIEGLAERTLKDHKTHLQFFRIYLETIQRSEWNASPLDAEIFKGYMAYMLLEKEYKPCTINVRLGSLKCYLKWLFENKYTPENFALKLKKVKTTEDTIQPLTDADIRKMLNTPDRSTYSGLRDFTIMLIILDCGIRIKELCDLKIEDVDLKNGFIFVQAENAKTRRYRELPIAKQTCTLLKQLIDIAEENGCKYIFNSSATAEKLNEMVVTKNFEKYGKRAGVTVRCTPYVFRHTFCTNMVRAGADLFLIQKTMGHTSIVTTRKYVQLDSKDLKKNHSKFSMVDRYLKGGNR